MYFLEKCKKHFLTVEFGCYNNVAFYDRLAASFKSLFYIYIVKLE